MFNASFNLVKFSPLTTPDVKKATAKKHSAEDEYVSSSSVASSVTHELHSISQSIQKKLSSDNEHRSSFIDSRGERSSEEEDLFITQKFSPQTNKTKKKASVQSHTRDVFIEPNSNNNCPMLTQTKEAKRKMKLQVTGKEKHGKAHQSEDMTKEDSSTLSIESSFDDTIKTEKKHMEGKYTKLKTSDKMSVPVVESRKKKTDKSSSGVVKSTSHKDRVSKKGTNEQELTKSRKSKSHSVSSSSESDDDSDSSSDSEIDVAKCRMLMERLKAKAAVDDKSESESDSELIHEPSQKLTKEQVKDRHKKDDPTEAESPVNFSQDLFSPKSDDDSNGDSIDAVRKSGKKSAKQQKLSPKRDKSYSEGAREQESELNSDVEAEEFHSEDNSDQPKQNKSKHKQVNTPDEETAVQDASSSESDNDSSMSDTNDKAKMSKKTDTLSKSKLSSSHSEDDSGSDLSDVADRPVKIAAKSSDTSSDSEDEKDPVEKLTQTAGVHSPETSSSDSESNSDSDTKNNTVIEADFTSQKNHCSDSEDDVESVPSDTGKKADTSHKADHTEAPESDSDSDIGSISDNNTEMFNKTDKSDKTATISSSDFSGQRGSTRQTDRAETPFKSTRQSKITDHCPPVASETKRRKMRYKPPEGFDIEDNDDKYATQDEVNSKHIWLIQTPVDFDISTLNNQKIKLEGIQTLGAKTKSEKQYEVFSRLSKDNQDVGCSVVYDKGGKPLLGAGISGQIQVLDWIPGIPSVEIDIPAQDKHRVPDNLRVRYVPFGSESPKRVVEPEERESEKHGSKRKHEKSQEETKKKKKKSKKDKR